MSATDFGPIDISTASWNIATATAWGKIANTEGAGKADRGSNQLARLFVSVDASAGAGTVFTLMLALVSASATIIGCVPVTCTVLAGRATGGTAGNFMCSVSYNGRDIVDLLGSKFNKVVPDDVSWMVGCPDALPAGAAHVFVSGVFTPIV